MNNEMIELFEIFTNNISVVYKGIQKLKNDDMKKFGLKGNHLMCLFYLDKYEEGLTASRLCELIGNDKAAVSRSLSELNSLGHICYEGEAGRKKYNTVIRLTEKGKSITALLVEEICHRVDEISLQGMDLEQRTALYRHLRTIANNITDAIKGEQE